MRCWFTFFITWCFLYTAQGAVEKEHVIATNNGFRGLPEFDEVDILSLMGSSFDDSVLWKEEQLERKEPGDHFNPLGINEVIGKSESNQAPSERKGIRKGIRKGNGDISSKIPALFGIGSNTLRYMESINGLVGEDGDSKTVVVLRDPVAVINFKDSMKKKTDNVKNGNSPVPTGRRRSKGKKGLWKRILLLFGIGATTVDIVESLDNLVGDDGASKTEMVLHDTEAVKNLKNSMNNITALPVGYNGPYNKYFDCNQIGFSRPSTTRLKCAALCDKASRCTAFNIGIAGNANQKCELEDCGPSPGTPTGVHKDYESWSKQKNGYNYGK